MTLQQLTPAGWHPGEGMLLYRKAVTQSLPLRQPALLTVGQLQAGCQGGGIVGTGEQGRQQRQSEPPRPAKARTPALVRLQAGIKKGQTTPGLQQGEGGRPGFTL